MNTNLLCHLGKNLNWTNDGLMTLIMMTLNDISLETALCYKIQDYKSYLHKHTHTLEVREASQQPEGCQFKSREVS